MVYFKYLKYFTFNSYYEQIEDGNYYTVSYTLQPSSKNLNY